MARTPDRRRSRGRGTAAAPPRRGWRLWLRRLLLWGGGLAILGVFALGVSVAFAARSLPSYDEMKSSQNGQMIVVRARDGTELLALGPSYGKWLASEQIPQVMKDAMVSVEDRRFNRHFGIDPYGIARAVFVSLRDRRGARATSTITQQLARNVFLNNNRTVGRKFREGVLAMALEAKFTKAQILELYLNKVYFGGGAYGIDSASRKFFGHPGTTLSLPEAAIIAGLVKAPSRYSPTADATAGIDRAKVVLGTMQDTGAITAAEAASADLGAVRLAPEEGQNSVRYFTDWALPQLDILLGGSSTEPIEVWTTLDIGMQRAATAAIATNVPGGAQGALVSLDRDGAVMAMVGGTDYVRSNYNRATAAVRQPGSAWKLFVYLAALESGYTPNDTVTDAPVTIDGWSPRNSGGTYAGKIDVRTAFAYSKNTVAAQLGNEVGYSAVAGMARRFGITTPINTHPSMVLGTSEVRVIDMTRAFAAVSAKGTAVEPFGILKVTNTDGQVLYEHKSVVGAQLVPAYVAAGITDLLQTAVNIGTGRAAQIGRPVAGKTGTTTSNKDGWFLGFSSGITTGVWMGRDDDKPIPGLQGGTAPARAFAAFMRFAVAKRPVEVFDTALQLPTWQLEPDDEASFAGTNDYYYIDEQGNLVDPRRVDENTRKPGEAENGDQGLVPVGPPPAAGDEFLNQATGGGGGSGGGSGEPETAKPPERPRAAPARPAPARTAPTPRVVSSPVVQEIN